MREAGSGGGRTRTGETTIRVVARAINRAGGTAMARSMRLRRKADGPATASCWPTSCSAISEMTTGWSAVHPQSYSCDRNDAALEPNGELGLILLAAGRYAADNLQARLPRPVPEISSPDTDRS